MSFDAQPPIRLPVWRLAKASLDSVFQHPGNFVHRVWPWVAIVAALTALLGIGLDMPFEETGTATIVIGLCLFVGPIMVVVSWHRGLLLGEPGGPSTAFRLDLPFWRYLAIGILVGMLAGALIMIPAAVLGGLGAGLVSQEMGAVGAGLGGIAALIAVLPASARVMLALPMAAIDATPPLLRGAWRLGRGNGWRLFGALLILTLIGTLLQYVPLMVVGGAIAFAAGDNAQTVMSGGPANLVIQPLFATTSLLNAALFASYASYTYAVLTNHPLGRDVTG